MRVGKLRKEAVARHDQTLTAARRWIFDTWPADDWQDIAHAIRDGVNAECLLRDNREHQIPLDGKLYEDETILDPATGKTKLAPIKVDPRRAGLRHGHREVRLESRRRLYALTVLRPEPATFYDLQKAIESDDGKDADGQWLCNRCVPERNRKSEGYPDGSGFDERLPKWMPRAVEESAPASSTEPIVIAAPGHIPDNVFTVEVGGCSECHGPKYGKGFRHAAGCTKSTSRTKATT
jgi:hypothetical protein